MRQMQAVLWTKGVLLTPQHLQTQDRFLEDQLGFQLSALAFSPWGFHDLEIDREGLAGGALALSRATGLFPDGLLFDVPDSDAAPPPRTLDGLFDPDQTTLEVYLAIPEYRYGGYNVSSRQRDGNTRYVAEVLLRRDENTGLAEKPIQVARKNMRLLVEGESLEGMTTLKVARVMRTPTGEFELDPHFVPPLVDLRASDYLLSIARRLIEVLSAKSSTLSGMRRQKNQTLADFGVSDVANFWLLYTVNTYLPQLRHLYETRRGHPAEQYRVMLALAGSLTTFSTSIHPRDLPVYDHSELATCFTDLDEKLRLLLETVVPANTVSLPMRMVQPSVYATALDQDRYLAAPQLYLAFNADAKKDDILRKGPQLIKIGSADHINHLIKQALPGVGMTYTASPPSSIPVKVNNHYFRIEKGGAEWDAIVKARHLAAYVPSDFPDPQLELVLLLPEAD